MAPRLAPFRECKVEYSVADAAPTPDGESAVPPSPVPTEPGYWTGQRRELFAWFERRAPHLGGLYRAGVVLLMDESIPDRAILVAHTVREVGNSLPRVFGIKRVSGTPRLVNQLAETWERCGLPTDFAGPVKESAPGAEDPPNFSIPQPAAQAVADLIQDRADADGRALANAELLFREISPETKLSIDQLRPVALKWVEVLKWFVSRAHVSDQTRVIPDAELRKNFETFEALLGSMLRPFFSTLKEVDEILEEANS